MRRVCALLLVLMLLLPADTFCWQVKSHEIATRAAVSALPQDVPAFFRGAVEELCYLVNEPDRWRAEARHPVLEPLESPNHSLFVERAQAPLPKTRYEYIMLISSSGKLAVSEVGTAHYAIAEYAEILTLSLRRWRKAPESTDLERRLKRQIEANIIHTAGILAHYVTDPAQPMHTSVHIAGWAAGFPNPKGYEGKDLHERFEGFADALISNRTIGVHDILRHMAAPKALGDWLVEAEKYIRRNHGYLEQMYEFDKQSAFHPGKARPEAEAFTVRQLAAGAEMLRDVWYSAWQKSKD